MKAAQVMFGYAGVLIMGGVIAFTIAAVGGAIQMTALIPVFMAAPMMAFGIMAALYNRNHTVGMIGIHAGLVLPLLYGAMFAYLAYARATAEEPRMYLVTIFVVMAVASFVSLGLLVSLRPKPEDRKPIE
jgi:hypothetical protein